MDINKKEETLEEVDLNNKIEPDKMIEDVLNDASLNSNESSSDDNVAQPNKIENSSSINTVANQTEDNSNNTLASDNNSNTIVDSNGAAESQPSNEDENYEYSFMSSGKKKLIIAILCILLVIDIAALVIYLIGIDKVLGFIK